MTVYNHFNFQETYFDNNHFHNSICVKCLTFFGVENGSYNNCIQCALKTATVPNSKGEGRRGQAWLSLVRQRNDMSDSSGPGGRQIRQLVREMRRWTDLTRRKKERSEIDDHLES